MNGCDPKKKSRATVALTLGGASAASDRWMMRVACSEGHREGARSGVVPLSRSLRSRCACPSDLVYTGHETARPHASHSSMRSHDARLQDARRCLDRGSLREALTLSRPLLGGSPLDPDACSVAGAALLGLGRAFQALRVVAPACAASPERAELQRLKLLCLLAGGRFELARCSAQRALRFDPEDAGLLGVVTQADARIAELRSLLDAASRSLLSAEQRAALGQDL